MIASFRDVYQYRELVWALTAKELKVRYKRSVLGFLWALLNPMLQCLVLTVVFSSLLRMQVPHYAIFLLSMLLPFTFFSQSVSYATESIVGNFDLLKKVNVPKTVFPLAAVCSNIINLLLSLIPLALIVVAMGHPFHATWLLLPIPILALTIFTVGATFFFATANVFYRDVAHVIQVVLQIWLYVTPIMYTVQFFPEQYRWLFKLNPLIFVMNDFRLSIYYGMLPQASSIVASFVCAFASLFIGYGVFRRYQDRFIFYA
jgi:ABC-type polysaccharide/polyol phosphate export permease